MRRALLRASQGYVVVSEARTTAARPSGVSARLRPLLSPCQKLTPPSLPHRYAALEEAAIDQAEEELSSPPPFDSAAPRDAAAATASTLTAREQRVQSEQLKQRRRPAKGVQGL